MKFFLSLLPYIHVFPWNQFHEIFREIDFTENIIFLWTWPLSFFLLFIRESDYKQLWRRGHLIEKQCTECFSLFESAVDLNNFGEVFVRHEKSRTLASILKLTLIEHCFVLFYTTGTILLMIKKNCFSTIVLLPILFMYTLLPIPV